MRDPTTRRRRTAFDECTINSWVGFRRNGTIILPSNALSEASDPQSRISTTICWQETRSHPLDVAFSNSKRFAQSWWSLRCSLLQSELLWYERYHYIYWPGFCLNSDRLRIHRDCLLVLDPTAASRGYMARVFQLACRS
jgi:hypothetical protein